MAWAQSRIASLITRHPKAAVTRMCRMFVMPGIALPEFTAVTTPATVVVVMVTYLSRSVNK
eukprot:2898849-Amphidinium_carterae.1